MLLASMVAKFMLFKIIYLYIWNIEYLFFIFEYLKLPAMTPHFIITKAVLIYKDKIVHRCCFDSFRGCIRMAITFDMGHIIWLYPFEYSSAVWPDNHILTVIWTISRSRKKYIHKNSLFLSFLFLWNSAWGSFYNNIIKNDDYF